LPLCCGRLSYLGSASSRFGYLLVLFFSALCVLDYLELPYLELARGFLLFAILGQAKEGV